MPLSVIGTAEENYIITLRQETEQYISLLPNESTFTVYDPEGRFFTGGGFILDPVSGEHNNFGLNVRFNTSGNPQGKILYITRNSMVGEKTRVKGNVVSAAGFLYGEPEDPPQAITEGKCNVEVYDIFTDEVLSSIGNINFSLIVEDAGLSGVDEDSFQMELRYSDGVPYEPHHMDALELLKGGNIVIHDGVAQ